MENPPGNTLTSSYAPIIEKLYQTAATQIITSGGLTEKIQLQKGVRQGDPISPLLFNLFINLGINKLFQ